MVEILPGTIANLADAIEARLKTVLPPDMFTYDWLPAQLNQAVWQQIITRPPAVKLQFAGFVRSVAAADLIGDCAFQIFLPVQNSRGARAGLFGDSLSSGALQVAQAAMLALHGMAAPSGGSVVVSDFKMAVFEERDDLNIFVPVITVVQSRMQIMPADVFPPGASILQTGTVGPDTIKWMFDGATVTDLETSA